jgi:hypothetical protein
LSLCHDDTFLYVSPTQDEAGLERYHPTVFDHEGLQAQQLKDEPDSESPPRRILGLRRTIFWTICLIIILSITAIGGGVGGYATRKKHNSLTPKSSSSTVSPVSPGLSPNSPLSNTSLAVSTRGIFNAPNSFLFFQANSLELFFVPLKTTVPVIPQSLGPTFLARRNTPLSAIGEVSIGGEPQGTRLFYADAAGYLSEAVYSSAKQQWTPGNLRTANIQLPEGSKFASTDWVFDNDTLDNNTSKLYSEIYYQDTRGKISATYRWVAGGRLMYAWGTYPGHDGGFGKLNLVPVKESALAVCNDFFKPGPNYVRQGLRLHLQTVEGDIRSGEFNGYSPKSPSGKWDRSNTVIRGLERWNI